MTQSGPKEAGVLVEELALFAAEVVAAAPPLRAALADAGSLVPDAEFPTSWAADVGRAIVDQWPSLTPAERAGSLAVVERHLASGSEQMRDVVATGLLEALASAVSGGRLSGPALAVHLGPRSRSYLDAWDQFTMGRSTLEGPTDPD